MHIFFTCGREVSYPRNSSFLRALRQLGTVSAVSADHPSILHRMIKTTGGIFRAPTKNVDLYFVGFFGQPLVFPARLRWKGPLVLDAFVSTYDTLCFDRQIIKPNSLLGHLALYLDLMSTRLADIVIVDTRSQASYFEHMFSLPSFKIRVVYMGCDDDLFKPLEISNPKIPIILFYGTFLPLHGVDVIIHAANLLRNEQILFQIIGQGQEYNHIRVLAESLNIQNIEFIPWVSLQKLPEIINQATICLGGPFGRSDKAKRVITSKTFQCLSAGRPTIVGDTSANRELFTHGENVWMCPTGDPQALAMSIQMLLDAPSLRAKLGTEGRKIIQQTCGNLMTAQTVRKVVEAALQHRLEIPRTNS